MKDLKVLLGSSKRDCRGYRQQLKGRKHYVDAACELVVHKKPFKWCTVHSHSAIKYVGLPPKTLIG